MYSTHTGTILCQCTIIFTLILAAKLLHISVVFHHGRNVLSQDVDFCLKFVSFQSMGAPSFSGRGWGGGGGGGHHLTAVNKLSAFGPFNQRVGVGVSAVYFWPIQSVRCEVSALSANPVIQSVGGGCCPLSMRMYVN